MKLLFRSQAFQILLGILCSVSAVAAQTVDCIDYSQLTPKALTSIYNSDTWEMEIVGDLGYVAGAGFSVWDVSDPRHPQRLSSLSMPATLMGLWISGNYAYVVETFDGLHVIDISDPLAPMEVGSVATPHAAVDLVGSGDLICVADTEGFATIDISTPSNPVLLGYGETTYLHCRDVALVDDVVFAGVFGSLISFDVSDPANPTEIARLDGAGQILGMAVAGNYAYYSAPSDGTPPDDELTKFRIVDISNPADMSIVGIVKVDRSTGGWDVAIRGNYAYLPDYTHGLLVINIENPAAPQIEGYGDVPYATHGGKGIALKGDTAILCAGEDGLVVYDISAIPDSDVLLIPGATRTLEVQNGLAYIGAGIDQGAGDPSPAGLRIVDVSDPANMRHLGSVAIPDNTALLGVYGSIAYLHGISSPNLYVVDASDPMAPLLIRHQVLPGIISDAEVKDGYLVVAADSAGVLFYDISSPVSPALVASVVLPAAANSVLIADARVYVTSTQKSLHILDWTVLQDPRLVGSSYYSVSYRLLGVLGPTAYLFHYGYPTITILDVSDPQAMEIVSTWDYSGSRFVFPFRMEMRGDTAYIPTWDHGVLTLNLSDPRIPQLANQVALPETFELSIENNSLYVLSYNYDIQVSTLFSLPIDCAGISAVPNPVTPQHQFHLDQNHPNPFNPRTKISFTLDTPQATTLKIFDLQGRLVRILLDSELRSSGPQSLAWDGRDHNGRSASAGVYLYRLETPNMVESRRMTLLK